MHRLPGPNLETNLRDGNQTLQTEAGGRHNLPFDLGHWETVWRGCTAYIGMPVPSASINQ